MIETAARAYSTPAQNATLSYPDNNPKTAMGAKKVPLHLVPPSAKHYLALALENGASKYGAYNWRDKSISVSVYKAALERHMDAFWDGEELAPDSGIHHVAHAMACCALILDAMTIGKLNDDRPTRGAASNLQEEYNNKKEVNDRTISTDPVPTGARQITVLPVGAGVATPRVVGRDGQPVYDTYRFDEDNGCYPPK